MGRFSNRSILYLHGYDSSAQGVKPNALRKLCTENRLLIPDLPLDPQECMVLAEDTLKTSSNDTIIIGASLGGFYAYYLASKFKKDCLLINPVFQPAMEAKKMLDAEENLEKKKLILNAANMYLAYTSTLNSMDKPTNCFVALGTKDMVINPEDSALHFSDAYVNNYEDDHLMLKNFEKVIEDFEEYIRART